MLTKALYYEDPEVFNFTAKIISREPDKKGEKVVLDQTQFYPEGGGQPADKGTLGGLVVTDVRKKEGVIWHHLEGNLEGDGPFAGEVEIAHRNDYRQQHTGQHLLSAAFVEVGNYPTVSVHQGEEYTTIEFGASEISLEDILEAEELANRIVCENRPVNFHWTDGEGLSQFTLRRPTKQTGKIRIVEVEDFDQAACGGVHFTTTGPVGWLKYLGGEKIRGNFRTYWAIGYRARRDYQEKIEVLKVLTERTSTPAAELPRRVEEMQAEASAKQAALVQSNKRVATLLAKQLAGDAREGILTKEISEDSGIFKEIALGLTKEQALSFCLLNRTDDEKKPLGWIIGSGIDTKEINFSSIKENLFPLIDAKGGGRAPLWQGAGTKTGGANEFLNGFIDICLK